MYGVAASIATVLMIPRPSNIMIGIIAEPPELDEEATDCVTNSLMSNGPKGIPKMPQMVCTMFRRNSRISLLTRFTLSILKLMRATTSCMCASRFRLSCARWISYRVRVIVPLRQCRQIVWHSRHQLPRYES